MTDASKTLGFGVLFALIEYGVSAALLPIQPVFLWLMWRVKTGSRITEPGFLAALLGVSLLVGLMNREALGLEFIRVIPLLGAVAFLSASLFRSQEPGIHAFLATVALGAYTILLNPSYGASLIGIVMWLMQIIIYTVIVFNSRGTN